MALFDPPSQAHHIPILSNTAAEPLLQMLVLPSPLPVRLKRTHVCTTHVSEQLEG